MYCFICLYLQHQNDTEKRSLTSTANIVSRETIHKVFKKVSRETLKGMYNNLKNQKNGQKRVFRKKFTIRKN